VGKKKKKSTKVGGKKGPEYAASRRRTGDGRVGAPFMGFSQIVTRDKGRKKGKKEQGTEKGKQEPQRNS